MEIMSPSSCSLPPSQEASLNLDEFAMQQSLMFSDCLQDLKNLRSQLYSAAEYFEVSYTKDDEKQIVVDTLKDYAVKALVNTVDHLGSVSYKVDGLLNEKVDEVSETDLRVSCIEQRLRTCHEYIDRAGLSQQSLVITTPKYHKRYILPADVPMPESGKHAVAHTAEPDEYVQDNRPWLFQQDARSTIKERSSSNRKARSPSPSTRARSLSPSRKTRSPSPSFRPGRFSLPDRRPGSPIPSFVPTSLARSGSLATRPALFSSPSIARKAPTEMQKSMSMHGRHQRDDHKETGNNPSKAKGLLKSLLSRRKMKNDDMLNTYLNEY